MKVILVVQRGNTVHINYFATVENAYRFYLKEFATFQEWWYYFWCAHTLLNRVHNEDVMEAIFRNVFNGVLIVEGRC